MFHVEIQTRCIYTHLFQRPNIFYSRLNSHIVFRLKKVFYEKNQQDQLRRFVGWF